MREFAAAEKFLLSRLRTRPALQNVDLRPSPARTSERSGVVWRLSTAEAHTRAVGGGVVVTPVLYQVTAWADGDDREAVYALAREVQAALEMTAGENADGWVWRCELERLVAPFTDRTDAARPRLVAGGVYRLWVRGKP